MEKVMSQKIGFWSVFAIVTGSQIGSGVFMAPSTLAPYGAIGLLGWLVSGFGALSLAYVFAKLCGQFPKTGGPHVFVLEAFGKHAAFFTGWTYWVVSFISSTAVIVTSIGYLSPFLPVHTGLYLALELLLLAFIVWLNLRGVKAAGNAEFFLTLLKFVPLLLLPAIGFLYFDSANLTVAPDKAQLSLPQMLGHVTLLTLWGFIGLESATAPAGSVENASKTIPRAILLGTVTVAIVYVFSSVGIMGLIPGAELATSKAPYVDAAQIVFGGSWHYGISIIASIVCIGTLNAWVLTSGQIALGLAEEGYLPRPFARTNARLAPAFSILISSFGIVPLLFLTNSATFAEQVTSIIDISVISFLFVYVLCCLSLLWISLRERNRNWVNMIAALLALVFCVFIISQTESQTLLIAGAFTLSGLPAYLLWRRRENI
jgi:APA family basic amino acid/polyamine antiporter